MVNVFTKFSVYTCNFYDNYNITVNIILYVYFDDATFLFAYEQIGIQYFRDSSFKNSEGLHLKLQHYGKMLIELTLICVYVCVCVCCDLSLQHYICNNSTRFVLFIGKL